MGVNLRQRLLLCAIVMIGVASSALAQDGKKMPLLQAAKGYAFCYCVTKYYNKADTACATKRKDYSGSYFVQETELSVSTINKITKFIDEQYPKYMPAPPAESRNGNMTCLGCWQLYESKALKTFLKKLMTIKAN